MIPLRLYYRLPHWIRQWMEPLLGKPVLPNPDEVEFVVLDTETTGLDYEKDRILCIGALKLRQQQIIVNESLELYVNQKHYDSQTTQVHGILSGDKPHGLEESEALRQLLAYVEGTVIVAHHAHFDMMIMNKALERNGMPKLTNQVLDTARLYRKTLIASPLVPKKDTYSLDEVADQYDISKKDRHTALGDAYITAVVFLKIVQRLKKKGVEVFGYA